MNKIKIKSEVGNLKKVLIHRPGNELNHLTPKWLNELLFDDIPWLKDAQNEHDLFKKILENEGVEIVYLVDLVYESLINDDITNKFVDQFINELGVNNEYIKSMLKKYLLSLDKKQMISEMMSGIPKTKFKLSDDNYFSLKDLTNDYPFITDPMPNLYYTRDPFSTIINGVSINKMYHKARQRETIFGEYIFKYHKDYKNTSIYYNRYNDYPIEGGDILVLSNNVLAIGLSERTSAEAIESLSKTLFTNTIVNKVLAIDIPKLRTFMHLDTALTQVDYNTFLVHHDLLIERDIFIITPNNENNNIKINKTHQTIQKAFSKALKMDIKMIPCGGNDKIASDREQWNDGANALAIRPGVVIVYERNTITNKLLKESGIKVIEMKSSELSRGRGGPRCMSMPLYREDL